MTETARLRLPEIAAAPGAEARHPQRGAGRPRHAGPALRARQGPRRPARRPDEGDCYIVADSATGDWTGWEGRIARYEDGAWRSFLPGQGDGQGWLAWDQDDACSTSMTAPAPGRRSAARR